MLRSDRRHDRREGDPDRRSFPRPPLWLTLTLVLIGSLGLLLVQLHRKRVEQRFASVLTERARTPAEVNRMKSELAEMDLTREALERELEGKLKLAKSLRSENFFISIDTGARRLRFYYGDKILREAPVAVGAGGTFTTVDGKRSWTFVPLKGAFPVEAKFVGLTWQVPEWVYAMKKQPAPPNRPALEGGLGRYVVDLGNGYVIHSPPVEGSPLQGAKPGSFMVEEEILRAIWPRIHSKKTPVYIY